MDEISEINIYSKLYRWLGLCIDYFAGTGDKEDAKTASIMRDDPSVVLEALVGIRMALITYKMTNVTNNRDSSTHLVKKSELTQYLRAFPSSSNQNWWPVWLRYFDVMDDAEWTKMWIALDLTIEDILKKDKV